MSKRVMQVWQFDDCETLRCAIVDALDYATSLGHHASTVYPNKGRMTLVEETLSDGSKVLNLCLFDAPSNLPHELT